MAKRKISIQVKIPVLPKFENNIRNSFLFVTKTFERYRTRVEIEVPMNFFLAEILKLFGNKSKPLFFNHSFLAPANLKNECSWQTVFTPQTHDVGISLMLPQTIGRFELNVPFQ